MNEDEYVQIFQQLPERHLRNQGTSDKRFPSQKSGSIDSKHHTGANRHFQNSGGKYCLRGQGGPASMDAVQYSHLIRIQAAASGFTNNMLLQ